MDIFSAPDTRVLLPKRIKNGLQCDRDTAKQYLKAGNGYTVERVEITNGSSAVYLKEVPGQQFNTVLFENVGPYYQYFYFYDEQNRLLRIRQWTGVYHHGAVKVHLIDKDGTLIPYPMTWTPNGHPPKTLHESRERFERMQAVVQAQVASQH